MFAQFAKMMNGDRSNPWKQLSNVTFWKKKWRKSGYGNSVPLNFVNQGSNGRLLNEALLLAKRLRNARN